MEGEVEDEDLIQREDMVVTVSHRGYIKRVPLSTYRAQRRGGKGRSGMATREEDVVTQIFIASTHTPVLFFSSRGMVYRMKVWRLPAATPQSRRQGAGQPAAACRRARSSPRSCRCRRTRDLGHAGADVRHQCGNVRRNKLCRLREHQPQRQDRHEARRGRPHRRRGDLRREQGRAADHGGAAASASRSRTCACSRAANSPACAASGSKAATR